MRKVGRKEDAGKPMWSLLPWEELEEVVMALNFGAFKYGENNWKDVESGERRYQDAAMRHLKCAILKEKNDKETGLDHYAHAIASLLFSFWHSRNRKNGMV